METENSTNSSRPDFDIVVNREQLIERILSPISRLTSKTAIVLDGERLFALANLSNETNGQLFMLSDIRMEVPYSGVASMVLTSVGKMIIALKAVKTETVTLHYDGTGLDYRSEKVAFRVRLSSETVALPFNKDKVLALNPVAVIGVNHDSLKEFSSLLAGFPNLNQLQIVGNESRNEIVMHNTDRSGVTDEKMDYTLSQVCDYHGEIPDDFIVYNFIFRNVNLANLGNIQIQIGGTFAMIVSENVSGNRTGGCIRYIIPKLKMRA